MPVDASAPLIIYESQNHLYFRLLPLFPRHIYLQAPVLQLILPEQYASLQLQS